MNDRMNELYLQAQKSVQFLSNSDESKQRMVVEKFGESIVKACIDTLIHRFQWDGDVQDGEEIKKCIERIQTRFGVI